MQKKYDSVVFDLDGTLLDTIEDIADAMNSFLEKEGLQTYSPEKYIEFIGHGAAELVESALGEKHKNFTIKEVAEQFLVNYKENWNVKTKPFSGINELLNKLRDLNVDFYILSNKPHDFTLMSYDYYFKNWEFKEIIGAKEKVPMKPDPTTLNEIISKNALVKQRTLFIGDSRVDMQTAKNAEVDSVAVTWGFEDSFELANENPTFIVQEPMEIYNIVTGRKV